MANFTPQEIEEILQAFFNVTGRRQYVGARYVPIFGRKNEDSIEWDNSGAYEPLTIVYHEGDTYTSRRYVPAGVDITDTGYWVITGRYNAQIEQYRQAVVLLGTRVDSNSEAINNVKNVLPYDGFSPDSTVKDYVDAKEAEIRAGLDDTYLPFPDGYIWPKFGTVNQVLATLANGDTKWVDPVIPSDEQAEEVITAWLNAHPEATTTVQDGAITNAKLNSNGLIKTALQFIASISVHDFNSQYGNLEDAPDNSMFRFQSFAGGSFTDVPSTYLGTVITLGFSGANDYKTQYYIENKSKGKIYYRVQNWTGTEKVWLSWSSLIPEPEAVDLSSYIKYIGSISFATFVSRYTSFNSAPSNSVIQLVSHGGVETIPNAPSENYGILFTFNEVPSTLAVQYYIESESTGTLYTYIRRQIISNNQTIWLGWHLVGSDSKEYVIDKSGTNSSLLEGILYCIENGIKNIRVKPGTYDMVSEYQAKYGSDWDTEIDTYSGIPLGYNMHIVFDEGAKVVFNYTGGRSNIHINLSMFNTVPSDCYLEGLNLECANLRYGIHDDCSGSTTPYIHTFKNCRIKKIDTNSDWTASCCIAGGFGSSTRIEIDGGMFMNNNTTQSPAAVSDSIYYHNNAALTGADASVEIHGIYCYGPKGTLHSGGQIQTDGSVATMFVHDCRFNVEPTENEPDAIKLYKWNNTIQTD